MGGNGPVGQGADQWHGRVRLDGEPEVFGVGMDAQTRCAHYHQAVDIIAIKHYCCARYYPCHHCHEELADHPVMVWPGRLFDEPAVLCGICRCELGIGQYLGTDRCPRCDARFNPGCKLHRGLYFSTAGSGDPEG